MFSRLFILFSLVLFPRLARAADYDRAMTTATVGGLAPPAGVAVVGAAYAASRNMDDDQQSAMALGSTMLALPLVVIGPPVLTGGALRARKALSEQGVEVSDLPGMISWGCFAGMLLVPSAYATTEPDADPLPWEIAQGSLFVAGYAAGVAQYAMVRKAHVQAASAPGLTLVPTGNGVAIAGRF